MATGGEESKVNGVSDNAGKELEDIIAEAEAQETKDAQEFQDQCAKELRERLDNLGKGFKHNVEEKFLNLESRYGDHQTDITKVRQTDVLRLNKLTRDVSRDLGTEWRDVFRFIMAGSEKEVIDAEVAKIEKEKPFIQAYKAIMRWRDVKSETGVDVDKLIEALEVYGKIELADHVRAILYSEGDELLQIGRVGQGLGGGARPTGAGEEGQEGAAAKPTQPRRNPDEHPAGPLGDRKLLLLAKKIGPSWFELAQLLGLSEEEISDVKGSEGATYQGAFKIIWLWRDRTAEEGINQSEVLREALKANNMGDVAECV